MSTTEQDVNEGQETGRVTLGSPPEYPNFKENCQSLRAILENNKRFAMSLMEHPDFQNEQNSKNQHGEMKANIMLTYRHLEDARMRMGKAIQAYDGGKSCYPK